MNEQWHEDWHCLECGLLNIGVNYQCSRCETDKPRECDMCGKEFIPWREYPKSKLEKWTCQKCYFKEPVDYLDSIDRDQGEDR